MKPRFKSYVHFAPTEEGVYVRTWSDMFILKGKGLYGLMEQVVPYLNGERTLDELFAPLPEMQAKVVRQLVAELVRRGVVSDSTADADAPLTEAERDLYRQTISYLEAHTPAGRQSFAHLRQRRLWLGGNGLAQIALVRSLLKMGVQTPCVENLHDPELREEAENWQRRDTGVIVRGVQPEDAAALFAEEATRPELVVLAADTLATVDLDAWTQLCLDYEVPLLVAAALDGVGVVGPMMRPDSALSWHVFRERWQGNAEKQGRSLPPMGRLMIGNLAAMECFKAVTGLPGSQVEDGVLLFEPEQLKTMPVRVLPYRDSVRQLEHGSAEGMARFADRREPEPLPAFLEHVRPYANEQVGPLLSLHKGDLPQIPLFLVQAEVRLPQSQGAARLVCVGHGEDPFTAEQEALLGAFRHYAQTWEASLRDPSASPLRVIAAGRSYDEWVGRGTLAALTQLVDAEGTGAWKQLPLQGRVDMKIGSYLKILRLRYEVDAVLCVADLSFTGSRVVAVVADGKQLACAAGRTEGEAALAALLQAVSRVQVSEQEMMDETPRFEVPAEHAVWQPTQEVPDWATWNEAMNTALAAAGMKRRLHPWTRDIALLELGILVGEVELCMEGSEPR
jgi:hypothetical protein